MRLRPRSSYAGNGGGSLSNFTSEEKSFSERKNSFSPANWGCVMWAIILIILVVVPMGIWVKYHSNRAWAQLTAEAPATILGASPFSLGHGKDYRERVAVRYRFKMNGQEVIRTKSVVVEVWQSARGVADGYRVGRVMKVCYNPKNIENPEPVLLSAKEHCGN